MRPAERSGVRARAIAVAGAKGSPGCTFLAVALAQLMAERGLATLLIDADAEEPGISPYLDLPPVAASPALLRAAGLGGFSREIVRDAATRADERLWCLELPRSVEAADLDGRDLVGAGRLEHQVMVVDVGHHLGRLQRQLMAAVDWVLWVVVPDRIGLDRADRALSAAGASAGSAGLVFNRMSRASLRGADTVLAERHRMPVMARLGEHRREAHMAEQRRPAHRQRAFRGPIEELGRTLHPQLTAAVRRRSSAWP